MKNTVRIGIIGIGNMGSIHARTILGGKVDRLTLAGISDQSVDRRDLFPEAPFFEDPEALIQSPEVDAVLVATPHFDHTRLGLATFRVGKHLLVEKPISVHKADCQRLIAGHDNPEQVFAAMFNQRTDPRYVKLKELIEGGQLGAIRRVVWIITDWFRTERYYASGGWRATWAGEGGGVLLNQCPHQLDLWQWLFGMPQKLRAYCHIGRYHEIEVEDDVTCYMEYADGCKGVFITTTGESPGTNRLEITAENGRVIIDGQTEGIEWKRNEVPMSEWNRTTELAFSKPPVWDVQIPAGAKGPQHQGILENFVKAILDGESLIAPGREGIRSVELANAMIYSSFTDQTLELPLDAAAYAAFLQERIATSTFVKKGGGSRISTDFDHA